MRPDHAAHTVSRTIVPASSFDTADVFGTGPRVELPRFDGSNPRLWQDRCEDYFSHWNTPVHLWIQYCSAQFEGPAARWLEAARRRIPRATWTEFCQHVMQRFGRNQHRTLVHRMIQIRQITTVTDYVDRFSELFDQLSAYEVTPDVMHYTTRFIEGLLPAIRMAIAIQQHADLDKAVELALLFEELVEEPEFLSAPSSPSFQSTVSRHPSPFQLQTKQSASKTPDDRRPKNHPRTSSVDDRWSQLRAYRKAKGLCFLCR
jgi:hypothetical protein